MKWSRRKRAGMAAPEPGIARHNVTTLGVVALFSGAAQEMIYPLLPAFVVVALGGSKTILGVVEGSLVAAVALSRLGSGWALHRGARAKKLTVGFYATSLVARPLLALAPSIVWVSALRVADGIGKGGKDAPRDSLVAAAAGSRTGRAFGIQRMLDTSGSVIGPLLAAAVLLVIGHSEHSLRVVFALAAIPGIAALLSLRRVVDTTPPPPDRTAKPQPLPPAFYGLLGAVFLFGLANSSDTLLLLRAQTAGVSIVLLPVLYAAFNLVYAAMAVPAGSLADRVGKRPLLIAAWIIYAAAYIGFAYADRAWQIWLLFLLYGLYYASAEGTAKAFVASVVPEDRRGWAYGLYATASGLLVLPAGVIAGSLWDRYGPTPPFLFGGVVAALAALLLAVVEIRSRRH